MRFQCTKCGAEHDTEEISFGAPAPLQWNLLSAAERERSELGEEQCIIESQEGTSYYLRACLEIPIQDTERGFTWGVWCSLSEKNFAEIAAHWDDPQRESIGPHFGWLCTAVPLYPDTAFLKTTVHQRAPGFRPLVELEGTGYRPLTELEGSAHPLAIDQQQGISAARLQEIVTLLLHEDAAKK
jgi:hypothetical protein